MISLGLGALILSVGGLGGFGVVVVAAYIDWTAWDLEESQELMD